MSKKRNKSRFTKTDVNTLCEMQRKIDAYEDFIVAICGMTQHKSTAMRYICLIKGTDMDEWMEMAWKNVQELIKVWNEKKPDE